MCALLWLGTEQPDPHPSLYYIRRYFLLPDDVIKWKHFQHFWSFVRGIHRSLVISLHKGQLRGALMFSLNCAWINVWVNNLEAGDLRRHRAHYDATVLRGQWDHSMIALGVGLLSEFPPFRCFPNFASLCKYGLAIQYRVYIWLESPKLRCDTSQIWIQCMIIKF